MPNQSPIAFVSCAMSGMLSRRLCLRIASTSPRRSRRLRCLDGVHRQRCCPPRRHDRKPPSPPRGNVPAGRLASSGGASDSPSGTSPRHSVWAAKPSATISRPTGPRFTRPVGLARRHWSRIAPIYAGAGRRAVTTPTSSARSSCNAATGALSVRCERRCILGAPPPPRAPSLHWLRLRPATALAAAEPQELQAIPRSNPLLACGYQLKERSQAFAAGCGRTGPMAP
jgi:hypothetical protein